LSNPTLFFAIAGVSMSFAGFAGLFLALRPHDTAWKRYEVGQLNTIVLFALMTLFGALLVVPLASLIGESAALRVSRSNTPVRSSGAVARRRTCPCDPANPESLLTGT